MSNFKNWVLASGNAGKAKEFSELLKFYSVQVLTLKDIGFTQEIIENGLTFAENSLIKAREVSQKSQIPVLADDSGLEVDALGGVPGVYSARYAGENATDSDNILKLLDALQGAHNRSAQFVCSLTLMYPGGEHIVTSGFCKGQIATSQSGANGFGYDPIFIPNGYSETFGVLDVSVKQKLSHRRNALDALIQTVFKN